ncbi:hypothetical protein B0H14DRAFT_575507 [Mycena olivaceomarginata]|nr:hypothetical protein B0H14DRAFT_575507 [Mycena olivaceomarginata]
MNAHFLDLRRDHRRTVSLVHAAFILRNGGIKVVTSVLVEDCLSLIAANIPVVVTTMVDIVGDADQARAARMTPFSTGFWYHETETAEKCRRRVRFATLDSPTDDMELSYTKSSKSTWNQNEQPDSEQVIKSRPHTPYSTGAVTCTQPHPYDIGILNCTFVYRYLT